MAFDAFISYSHADGGRLASALQSGLQGFARPWYKLRAIRVFRDKTSLAVNAGLWPSIEKALEQSEYFVVLASPAAAGSPWVRREIDYWLTHRPPQTLLVVVTEGTVTWDAPPAALIDPMTALPPRSGAPSKTRRSISICLARRCASDTKPPLPGCDRRPCRDAPQPGEGRSGRRGRAPPP